MLSLAWSAFRIWPFYSYFNHSIWWCLQKKKIKIQKQQIIDYSSSVSAKTILNNWIDLLLEFWFWNSTRDGLVFNSSMKTSVKYINECYKYEYAGQESRRRNQIKSTHSIRRTLYEWFNTYETSLNSIVSYEMNNMLKHMHTINVFISIMRNRRL